MPSEQVLRSYEDVGGAASETWERHSLPRDYLGGVLTILASLMASLGCATIEATHGGSGYRTPGLTLGEQQVLVGRIPDGSGDDGVIVGSGDLMTQRVRKELLKGGLRIASSEKSTAGELLTEASSGGIPFVLVGRIPKWVDNATEWSDKLDYSSIALELYRVTDKTLVASSDRNVQGVTVPEDWAGWLAAAAVADILGKPAPPW